MADWQCCCRRPQSRQISLSCCRGSSGSRRLHSWHRWPQQLDSALRTTRYKLPGAECSTTKNKHQNTNIFFLAVTFRPSWCMQQVCMTTWETTSLLETPSSSQTCQRWEGLLSGVECCWINTFLKKHQGKSIYWISWPKLLRHLWYIWFLYHYCNICLSVLHLWYVHTGQAEGSGVGQPGVSGPVSWDGGSVGQLLMSPLLSGRQTKTAGAGW